MRNSELIEEVYRMLKYQYAPADILTLIKKERPELKEKFEAGFWKSGHLKKELEN